MILCTINCLAMNLVSYNNNSSSGGRCLGIKKSIVKYFVCLDHMYLLYKDSSYYDLQNTHMVDYVP